MTLHDEIVEFKRFLGFNEHTKREPFLMGDSSPITDWTLGSILLVFLKHTSDSSNTFDQAALFFLSFCKTTIPSFSPVLEKDISNCSLGNPWYPKCRFSISIRISLSSSSKRLYRHDGCGCANHGVYNIATKHN